VAQKDLTKLRLLWPNQDRLSLKSVRVFVYNRFEHLLEALASQRIQNFVSRVRIPSLAPIFSGSGIKPALCPSKLNNYLNMVLPTQPVALSVEQIGELNQKLSTLRHDLNNSLSLIAATAELIRRRPATTEHMWATLHEQPRKITAAMAEFSRDMEAALKITR
jgi:hypothetical protein